MNGEGATRISTGLTAAGGVVLGLILLLLAPGHGRAQGTTSLPDNAAGINQGVLEVTGDNLAGSQVIGIAENAAKDDLMLWNDHGWKFFTPATGCVVDNPNTVRCPVAGVTGGIVVDGRGGDDTLQAVLDLPALKSLSAFGGDGNDKVIMDLPALKLVARGGPGKDRLMSGPESSALFGGAQRDKLIGRGGRDGMNGGKGEDTCKGGSSKDVAKACETVKGVP